MLPRKLAIALAFCMAGALAIAEGLYLAPSLYFWTKSHEAEAIERVRFAWYQASDPGSFLSIDEKSRFARRMINDGLITGGVLYDSAGDPLAVFGERPLLDLSLARLSGVKVQHSPNTDAFDVHLSPSETGLAHDLILRLPNAPVEAATAAQMREFGLSVLMIAALTAVLFLIACWMVIIQPLKRINAALRGAVRNPDRADSYVLATHRRDEIGQIATSLDLLLASFASLFHNELATLKGAHDGFAFGIIQFGEDQVPVAANPAALRLFSVDDIEGLRRVNMNCASLIGAKRSEPGNLLEVLDGARVPALLGLHVDAGMVTALGYPTRARSAEDEPESTFIALVPIDELMRDARKALGEAKRADVRLRLQSAELQEMRRQMEACLCLLEAASAGDPSEKAEAVLPDRILNNWYSDAARDGLVSGKLEHGLLPRVHGRPSAIRKILRQALLLVYAHTDMERPFLKVDAEPLGDGTMEIIIRDVSADRIGTGEKRKKSIDPTLPRAAMLQTLLANDGTLVGLETQAGSTTLRITMPMQEGGAAGTSEDEADAAFAQMDGGDAALRKSA